MTKIKMLIDDMEDEIKGAKAYAERYLECKASSNAFSKYYLEMANQELQHSNYLHQIISAEIDKLKTVYTPPIEMEEDWQKSHKKYVERVAWIKQMLSM